MATTTPQSSDVEALVALLVEADEEIKWWAEEHECCRGHEKDLRIKIAATLSRVTGRPVSAPF